MTDPNDRALLHLRVAGMSLLGFLLMVSYALARPAAEALFLQAHGKNALPYVWLLVAGGSALVVWIYNRLVTQTGLLALFAWTSLISAILFAALAGANHAELPGARYALYVWKDLYIVVLFEIFYSYNNSVFPIQTARWVYGFFGILGAVGSATGSFFVGTTAKIWGSEMALWLLVPLLGLLALVAYGLGRRAGICAPQASKTSHGSLREGFAIVRESAYLLYVLALIGSVQIVITLIDFDFNALVSAAYAQVDAKTAVIGDIYAVISVATIALHAVTGPTLRILGVPITLLSMPVLFASTILAYGLWPRFSVGAAMKVASKSFDYTLLRAAKEILYIPLSYRERTQGKAMVDMLTYRVAKGVASLLVLGLVYFQATALVRWLALAVTALWLVVTTIITRRFRQEISREDELRARDAAR
ncbi:MAG: hypothetical protein KAI47_20715 [Deltaproteobacteria bacterium]|nr:hypothetical protein [Deltaproteobacteria bacterium]